jgi:HEAT repeat protein
MSYRILLSLCLIFSMSALAADSSKTAGKVMEPDRPLPPVPRLRNVPIDQKLATEAMELIKSSLTSSDRIIRAHAIEASRQLFREKAKDDILKGLRDAESVVRFTAAMAIGDIQLVSARDELLKLVSDEDPNVRVAIRYALHRVGDTRFSHDLERYSLDPDVGVRGNTAMVLGRLEVPSAVKILMPMQHDLEPLVRIQAAEALFRLGDERGLRTLVAMTISAYPDDNIVGFQAIASTKNQTLLGHVQAGLSSEYVEVALAAARAMGDLGSDLGYGIALDGAKSKDPRRRYMAASALGSIGRTDSQEVLSGLLHDKESADTRLAAAFSILQIGQTATSQVTAK